MPNLLFLKKKYIYVFFLNARFFGKSVRHFCHFFKTLKFCEKKPNQFIGIKRQLGILT